MRKGREEGRKRKVREWEWQESDEGGGERREREGGRDRSGRGGREVG
jgi:hypothetical protein